MALDSECVIQFESVYQGKRKTNKITNYRYQKYEWYGWFGEKVFV